MALLALTVAGCSPATAPHDPLPVTDIRSGEVGPLGWTCGLEFPHAIEDAVRVSVVPMSLSLEIRRGPCSGPSVLVAASTGAIRLVLASGWYHVRIRNPGNSTVSYVVEVNYIAPGA